MGSLFGGKKSSPPPPPAPEPKPPAPMPDLESPEVQEARRRRAAEILARGGRTSTILTAPGQRGSDVTVGDTYAGGLLGTGAPR